MNERKNKNTIYWIKMPFRLSDFPLFPFYLYIFDIDYVLTALFKRHKYIGENLLKLFRTHIIEILCMLQVLSN